MYAQNCAVWVIITCRLAATGLPTSIKFHRMLPNNRTCRQTEATTGCATSPRWLESIRNKGGYDPKRNRNVFSVKDPSVKVDMVWPWGTGFSKLPCAVTTTVDHPLGSPSLTLFLPVLPSAVISTIGQPFRAAFYMFPPAAQRGDQHRRPPLKVSFFIFPPAAQRGV